MTNNTLSKKEKDVLRKQQHSEIERKRRLKVNKRFDELRELVSKDTQNVNSKPTDFKLQILDQTVSNEYACDDRMILIVMGYRLTISIN